MNAHPSQAVSLPVQEPKRKMRPTICLVQLVGFPIVLATLLGFAGEWHWIVDLFSHFRFQYLLMLVVCVVATALLKAWRTGLVLACGVAVNVAAIVPLFLERDVQSTDTAAPLRLAAVNVHTANRSFDTVIDTIARQQPDIVFFQETDEAWIEALSQGLSGYQTLQREARSDNFGVLVMMRTESMSDTLTLVDNSIVRLARRAADVPSVELTLRWHGRPVHLLCVHTTPPVNRASVRGRDRMLEAIEHWHASLKQTETNSDDAAFIVIGDLNATTWSAPFRQLIDRTNLIDSSRGFGWQPTWPSGWLALGQIPIDHCLHSPNLVTVRREVDRTSNGSDHFPLLVELSPLNPNDPE